MKQLFKEVFALTNKGADDTLKATISSFFTYIMNILPAILLMFFIDDLLKSNMKKDIFYIGISLLVIVLMYFLTSIDYDNLYNATYRESANLRIEIADIFKNLPLSYFSKHDLSDLSQTVMDDVERIEHAISHSVPRVVAFFIYLPILSIMLLSGNFKMGLAVLIPIYIAFLLVLLSKKIQVLGAGKYFTKLRENSEAFQEAIELQQEIKSLGLIENMRNKLYKKMEETEIIHIKAELSHVLPLVLSSTIVQLSLTIVILIGTILYINNEISLLYFIGYILFSMKIKEAVDSINQNITELFFLDARVKRIKEIRQTKIQDGYDKNLESYDIHLNNVSFSYTKDSKVLDNLSFTAKQGEVTALVGVSGCGKTSILRLISRLYDYDSGSIKIGDDEIKNISTSSLFDKISIVFQDVTLFNTSVMENIRLGKLDASDEEVIQAAKLANCEEFINKLPDTYHTKIGENGAKLSGGERQRISIARAFLKNAPIIILDEISSSLDVENEKKIQDSLNKLIKNKTVIIISHRLKSIENADKIVVIDNAKVESFGTHKQLLSKSKVYQKLIQKSKLAEDFKY